MMTIATRRMSLPLSLMLGSSVAIFAWLLGGMGSMAALAPEDQLTGVALAKELGLELHDDWPGCSSYVEIADDGTRRPGYCLNSIPGGAVAAWEVGRRLQGYVPSAAEVEALRLMQELSTMSEVERQDAAHVEQLILEIEGLEAEISGN